MDKRMIAGGVDRIDGQKDERIVNSGRKQICKGWRKEWTGVDRYRKRWEI